MLGCVSRSWGVEELGVGRVERKGDEAVPGASSSHSLGTPPSPGMFGLQLQARFLFQRSHLLMWG